MDTLQKIIDELVALVASKYEERLAAVERDLKNTSELVDHDIKGLRGSVSELFTRTDCLADEIVQLRSTVADGIVRANSQGAEIQELRAQIVDMNREINALNARVADPNDVAESLASNGRFVEKVGKSLESEFDYGSYVTEEDVIELLNDRVRITVE